MLQNKDFDLYRDIDLSFRAHPLSGDISALSNAAAVRRAIRNVCKLNAYDIPFQPTFKTNLKAMLFEPVSSLNAMAIQSNLEWAFKKLEPRAKIESVSVEPGEDGTGYEITVKFMIRSLMTQEETTFFVRRVR